MHDFSEVVRAHLGRLDVDPAREFEIREELTAHLADAFADARRRGHSDEDAMALAMGQVEDWQQLAQHLRRAEGEGSGMSHHTKTLWLPGMTMLGCAAVFVLATLWLAPGERWANPDARVQTLAAAFGLLLYAAFGATGAAWSRRAGGGWRERCAAGLFPLALHVAMVLPAIGLSVLHETFRHPTHPLNPQLGVVVALILAPGLALLLGAAPFLRGDTNPAR